MHCPNCKVEVLTPLSGKLVDPPADCLYGNKINLTPFVSMYIALLVGKWMSKRFTLNIMGELIRPAFCECSNIPAEIRPDGKFCRPRLGYECHACGFKWDCFPSETS